MSVYLIMKNLNLYMLNILHMAYVYKNDFQVNVLHCNLQIPDNVLVKLNKYQEILYLIAIDSWLASSLNTKTLR